MKSDMKQTEVPGQIELVTPTNPNKTSRRNWRWLVVAAVGFAVILVLATGIRSRVKAASALGTVTAQMAVPSVSVVAPKRTAPAQEIILPGNIQPFITSPIYARTDGYIKKWYFDIGAHVKAGDLLAVIQAPEVDELLAQSRSTMATAQANLALAQITKDRYQALLKKHAVSQQDFDNANGTYAANKA